MKTAFLFPGQGSQAVGMSHALTQAYPTVQQTFERANQILGYDLAKLCFEGPAEQLNETIHTQPALFVAGVATFRALHEKSTVKPVFVAGHSLGEFTALVAAEALTFEDGLRLVHTRASLMRDAGEKSPGAVAALLGLDTEAVKALCADAQNLTGEIVVLANDNCPGQVVISGSHTALDKALELATERGAKRAVKLAVSVAVHSPLMQDAGSEFQAAVEATPFQTPQIPIVANVTAQPITTVEAIRHELSHQITSSVRWTESIQTMLAAGVENFVELGPGGVLKGLLKRIDRSANGLSIETPEDLEKYATP